MRAGEYKVGKFYNTKKELPRPIDDYNPRVRPFLLDPKPKKLIKSEYLSLINGYLLEFEGYGNLGGFHPLGDLAALEEVTPYVQEEMEL